MAHPSCLHSSRLKKFIVKQPAPRLNVSDDIFQLHSDESFPQDFDKSIPRLPPPMPTLDELRKIKSSTSWSHLTSQPASSEPPFSQPKNRNATLAKHKLNDFFLPGAPPSKKPRKLQLASSFFDDTDPENLHDYSSSLSLMNLHLECFHVATPHLLSLCPVSLHLTFSPLGHPLCLYK